MSLPISHVTIFKKTGLVLWSRAVEKMRGDPVSQLIQNYLLEEKGGAARRATIDAYELEWRFVNEGDLVVVDNYLASHGRMGWVPPAPRRVLLTHFVNGPTAEPKPPAGA